MTEPGTSITESFEMISLTEYSRRMNVCRNTVRNWMSYGDLKEEKHYLRKKRIIRFIWSREIVKELMREWSQHLTPRPLMKGRNTNRRTLKYCA